MPGKARRQATASRGEGASGEARLCGWAGVAQWWQLALRLVTDGRWRRWRDAKVAKARVSKSETESSSSMRKGDGGGRHEKRAKRKWAVVRRVGYASAKW